jgi:hypothetical protein
VLDANFVYSPQYTTYLFRQSRTLIFECYACMAGQKLRTRDITGSSATSESYPADSFTYLERGQIRRRVRNRGIRNIYKNGRRYMKE